VTLDNLAHFNVTFNEKELTLTAKDGYTFGNSEILEEKTLSSIPSIELTKLPIVPKESLSFHEYILIKDAYEAATAPADKIIELNKLFTGVTSKNFAYFDVNAGENIFTLTAKDGYTFGNPVQAPSLYLSSKSPIILKELQIASKTEVIRIYQYKSIKNRYLNATNQNEKINVLNELFTGVNKENVDNFVVKWDDVEFKVELEAVKGYTFGKVNEVVKSKLFSEKATPLNEISITPQEKVTNSVYKKAKTDFENGATTQEKVNALNLLFTNVNLDNFAHFDVVGGALRFTLKAKTGYTFGGPNDAPTDIFSVEPSPDAPDVQTEIDKFTKEQTTLKTNEGVVGAVFELREIKDQAALKVALDLYLTTKLPTLSVGFEFSIDEFKVDNSGNMVVKLSITKIDDGAGGFAIMTITGFAKNQNLEDQFNHISFNDITLFDPTNKAQESLDLLSSSELEVQKQELVRLRGKAIDLNKGFGIKSISATFGSNKYSLLVTMIIENLVDGSTVEKTILIDGWPEPIEIQKLNITVKPAVKMSVYNKAKVDFDAIVNNPLMNRRTINASKIEILNILFSGVDTTNIDYFEVVTGPSYFTLTADQYFTFGDVTIDRVPTLLSLEPTPDSTAVENEIKRIIGGTTLKGAEDGVFGAVYLLNKITNPASQRIEFDKYFKLVEPSEGFTYTIKSIDVKDGEMEVEIFVSHGGD
ncbi:MAG: hypothetical protein KFW07_02940, partial [Mycoplasmataceae bacterium]|nr:hypothetical protein [Mycoplasmataceae bacterium]